MSDAPTYETTDLGIAAALFTAGIPLSGVKPEPPSERYKRGRAIFCFSDPEKAKACVQDYFRGMLKVDAKSYMSTYLEYRRLAYNKDMMGH